MNCDNYIKYRSVLPVMPTVRVECFPASSSHPTDIATYRLTARIGIVKAELAQGNHMSWLKNGQRIEEELLDVCQASSNRRDCVKPSPATFETYVLRGLAGLPIVAVS